MTHSRRLVASLLFLALLPAPLHAASREVLDINPGWRFWLGDAPAQAQQPQFDDGAWNLVSLPHTHELFPANLKGYKEHGRNLGFYRRSLTVAPGWAGKRVFLHFQGAMQATRLWVNGSPAGEYAVSGYDSFHFDITPHLRPGQNSLVVRVDNTPNPDLPPDGRKTDFIQFGGLHRDVQLVVADPVHITFPWEAPKAGVRLTLPEVSAQSAKVRVETTVRNASQQPSRITLLTEIRDKAGNVASTVRTTQPIAPGAAFTFEQDAPAIANPQLWSPENPYLYNAHTILLDDSGKELDRVTTRLGVRWFQFDKQTGFSLNGKPLKLIGANRHETWPFIGNAVPNGLHRRDAEQLKAMGVNWVRLSHYPHDPDFLDALDELGLMALEEGPTWMGVGGPTWVANLDASFRSMIRRDRNHPSIIIWNTCINHAGIDRGLARAALEEDPTRPRGQDNVPTPMNFRHKEISGGAALTIEHTGHIFPTFRGDRAPAGVYTRSWELRNQTPNREYEHARRHWEHTNAAYLKKDNSGMAVWCMYDYNTFHNAFDNIAPHGVADLFRLPKFSYYWHMSELTEQPMAKVVRVSDDLACVFSNGQQVRLSQDLGQGYAPVATQAPDKDLVLRHPPFHFKIDPKARALKAEALVGNTVAATAEWKTPGEPVALVVEADRATLTADGSDLSRIVVSAVDAQGTLVDTSKAPIRFSIQGPGQLVGENPTPLRAGQMIVLAQSSFAPGEITVTASAEGLKTGAATVRTTAPAAHTDVPEIARGKAPTRSDRVVIPNLAPVVEQPWLAFPAKRDVARYAWIESDPIMIPGELPEATIEVRGGEYRVYTSPWTSAPGKVHAGDAVFVRVRAGSEAGDRTWVDVKIGNMTTRFETFAGRSR